MLLDMSKNAGALLVALTCSMVTGNAEPWSFGVMGDTQWRQNLDGENPGTVSAGIIRQINAQFIVHQVKFVVQVGDLVDVYSDANGRFSARSAACADLYSAGIGFFPVRGNHESSAAAAIELPNTFPQTTGSGSRVFGAGDFTSPTASLQGVSYSFRYNNATFVLIDQFTRKSGSISGVTDQIDWLGSTLASRPGNTHAFVFSHKNLCGGNHADGLFGNTPADLPTVQNDFYRACASNGVRYFMSGHDHMHLRSVMTSPDRLWNLEQLIASSNSYKFYIPLTGANINDVRYNKPPRETPITQELFTIGYYIFTVDGPLVTVDYYASPNGCNGDCDLTVTPKLTFSKHETYGYGLNGKKFIVRRGEPFSAISDAISPANGYFGTSAAILGGTNSITSTLYDVRPTVNSVSTGWRSRTELEARFKSDAVTLFGMQDSVGSFGCEPYTLSMSYDPTSKGPLALNVKTADGSWERAIGSNSAGVPKFVVGPWKETYGIGTYGIDPATKTVWAVINHASEFAVAPSTDGDQNGDNVIDNTDVGIVQSLRNEPASVAPEADLDNDGKITMLDARKLALIKN